MFGTGQMIGIPRTRGDGPLPSERVGDLLRDSPHPRGWTRHVERAASALYGFPAPAGMDPSHRLARRFAPGIPRTRGDGPDCLDALIHTKRDSPHPRGWTGVV